MNLSLWLAMLTWANALAFGFLYNGRAVSPNPQDWFNETQGKNQPDAWHIAGVQQNAYKPCDS